ncbi:hypothetical protein HJFPF1_10293 [Paramyrothecium foliicola]|nr:hypothetical protein HJFPF1_10293 [Paramyrothecium foliicola]
MPLCSLFMISLSPHAKIGPFISDLLSNIGLEPVFIARPLKWMINPWISSANTAENEHLSTLRGTAWDVVVIFPSAVEIPLRLRQKIDKLYGVKVGISSKILSSLDELNKKLLDPSAPSPPLTGSLDRNPTAKSSKHLELTDELRTWFSSPAGLKTPPSMLNFLTFHPGKHESYVLYGQAFAKDVGRRRGGLAKIVGPVVSADSDTGNEDKIWEEIAVAHYPSVWHFGDMIMGEDYQEVNTRHRVGALRGTGILCCNELDEEVLAGIKAAKLKPRI